MTSLDIVNSNAKILIELINERATLAQETNFNNTKGQASAMKELSEEINEAMWRVNHYTADIIIKRGLKQLNQGRWFRSVPFIVTI